MKLKLKNKKGFTFAQLLLYVVLSLLIFSVFFAFIGNVRSSNLNFINSNDMMYEVYNVENLVKDIKYATDINYVCTKGNTSCDSSKINITVNNKNGMNDKEYSYKNKQIILIDNYNKGIPQYFNVDSVSFTKITNTTYQMKLIAIEIKFSKGKQTFTYKTEVSPNAWLNKTVGEL